LNWLEEFQSPEKAFGEVVNSTHVGFGMQAYRYGYGSTPEYGSLVVVNCEDFITVGVVVGSEMSPAPGLPTVPTPMRSTRKQVEERYPDLEGRLLDIYTAISVGHYADGRFRFSRPRRKPLIHDLAFAASDEFIRDFHTVGDECTLDYFPLIVHALPRNDLSPFADVYFSLLAEKFAIEERAELYESLAGSLAKWGDEECVAELIDLARRHLMEGST